MADMFSASEQSLEARTQGIAENEPPYLPPQRACFICGNVAWSWNGDRYVCAQAGAGNQAHIEHEQLEQVIHLRYFG